MRISFYSEKTYNIIRQVYSCSSAAQPPSSLLWRLFLILPDHKPSSVQPTSRPCDHLSSPAIAGRIVRREALVRGTRGIPLLPSHLAPDRVYHLAPSPEESPLNAGRFTFDRLCGTVHGRGDEPQPAPVRSYPVPWCSDFPLRLKAEQSLTGKIRLIVG